MIKTWRVGDLAKATGLTVRTLHYYEQIGLVIPSSRSKGGHRLYSPKDVFKLQQILALKYLGVSLGAITASLTEHKFTALAVVKMQLAHTMEQSNQLSLLQDVLNNIGSSIENKQEICMDNVLKAIELTSVFEKTEKSIEDCDLDEEEHTQEIRFDLLQQSS